MEYQQEVFDVLSQTLDEESLRKVCQMLDIETDEVESGNKHKLIKIVLKYLVSEEVEESTDQGEAIFYKLYTMFKKYNLESPRFNKPPSFNFESQKQSVRPRASDIQSTSYLFGQSKFENSDSYKTKSTNLNTTNPFAEETNERDQNNPFLRIKEFKIVGKIGSPGQKDRLTFTSLSYQIESGKKKGYREIEIIHAVISSISPDLELRGYLEGKPDLNLPLLKKILRSHFKEPDSSTLFTHLSNGKQSSSETAIEYVIRLMNLRQKLLFVSDEDPYMYDAKLVQNKFLQAIFTGLKK